MIKFENTEVMGWKAAIRGMRNPMNSWEKSDSYDAVDCGACGIVDKEGICEPAKHRAECEKHRCYEIGPNDLDLMRRLAAGGPVHAKYRRYIVVYVDITAPIYWWTEFDTYRTGVTPNPMDIEMNSTSTMHKIAAKEFTLEDFSHDHLGEDSLSVLQFTIDHLNKARDVYLETKDKDHWWQMIQLLPNSYHYRRTVMMNYEVLAHIWNDRRNHKLDEWREHEINPVEHLKDGVLVSRENSAPYRYIGFCDWIKTLPYSEIITGVAVNAESGAREDQK